jgi:hypothetical protein
LKLIPLLAILLLAQSAAAQFFAPEKRTQPQAEIATEIDSTTLTRDEFGRPTRLVIGEHSFQFLYRGAHAIPSLVTTEAGKIMTGTEFGALLPKTLPLEDLDKALGGHIEHAQLWARLFPQTRAYRPLVENEKLLLAQQVSCFDWCDQVASVDGWVCAALALVDPPATILCLIYVDLWRHKCHIDCGAALGEIDDPFANGLPADWNTEP